MQPRRLWHVASPASKRRVLADWLNGIAQVGAAHQRYRLTALQP